jgi:GH3 auxin-responsive promoter
LRETFSLRAVHAAYRFFLTPARRRFERAACRCEQAQTARLRSLVKTNRDTAYGRAHRFDRVSSVTEWQRRVPIIGYEDLEPWIRRAADGERGGLTAAPIRAFERTSGSTAANKLVPYTDALLADFGAATGPWLHDLYTGILTLRGTKSYWAGVFAAGERRPDRVEGAR